MACSPVASRVLDVILSTDPLAAAESGNHPTTSNPVPFKARRKLVMLFLDHFTTLVDDKIGSRVADRCWAVADPYLRVSLSSSLVFFFFFFARSLE